MIKLGIFARTPDIYQAPLWKELCSVPGVNVMVYYFLPGTTESYNYSGEENNPLFEGYKYKLIYTRAAIAAAAAIPKPDDFFAEERLDIALLSGCLCKFERQARKYSEKYRYKIIFRGEITHMEYSQWLTKNLIKHYYLKWFYRGIDAFCPVGKDAERHLLAKGIPEEKLFFSPNAVDDKQIERLKRLYDREKIRNELGIRENEVVFLFAGSMIERNQPMMLADAAIELKNSSKMVLVFVGGGPQMDPVFRRLKPILGRRLLMPGACDFFQSGYYFTIADVFVMPSEYSAWGLEVNMAMHWEIPVIVSDRCGCSRDLVIDGYTGYSYFYKDGISLVRYMRKFLTENNLASKMGIAAYQEIRKYSLKNSVEGLTEAINYVGQQREFDRVKFHSKDPFK